MPGRRLGLGEREEIRVGLVRGESLRQIARRLGRPVWMIAREVDRNGGRTRYVAAAAQRRAERCARRPKTPLLVEDAGLARRVTRRLVEDRESPTTIARPKGVSHETITQAIYRGDRGLDPGLWRHLHHQRRRRRRRRCPGEQQRLVLGQFRPIARRPAAASRRRQVGHLEGDLIIGANNASAAVTIIDRATRFCLLGALPDGYGAASVAWCVTRLLRPIPEAGRRTLTWDQGREMALWADIEQVLGTPISFADPHAPWQRPVNENFNGLVRRWLAKSTDLSIYSQADLDAIARRINHMPRRSLNWGHAHRHYYDALVAMTG
jgi:IS30 family transposase